MSINFVIAVTDGSWFKMLRRMPDLDEVNFWAPSSTNFRALRQGELFLFKLHSPHNFVVGGGTFVHASTLSCTLAWEMFQEANGARSLPEMRQRITRYRRTVPAKQSDFTIGCRILAQPFFFEEEDWIPVPASWSPNIVVLKTYSTEDAEGRGLWEAVTFLRSRILKPNLVEVPNRFGLPQLIRPRLGQGAFRTLVRDIYQQRCAVTMERTLPALEAAHIRPFSDGGIHEPSNGLLLRRDIHSLFDTGYVTVTPEHHFEVSRFIKEEFENGREYYALHGRRINLPRETSQRPRPDQLRWHNEHCFRG